MKGGLYASSLMSWMMSHGEACLAGTETAAIRILSLVTLPSTAIHCPLLSDPLPLLPLIQDFYGIPVNCQDVALVSTPPQLEDFVRKVSSGQVMVPGPTDCKP